MPAVTDWTFDLTHTKFPVKFALDVTVLVSAVNVVPDTSNQSSSAGAVASEPCILIVALALKSAET